jgi:hypothetical protein
MTPETKKILLRSYECQLKSSGKPERKAEYQQIIDEISALPTTEQVSEIKDAFSAIMAALQANPNCSQEMLFECCANAFEIAEKAKNKLN